VNRPRRLRELRDQLLRLWHRDRGQALWLGSNVVAAALVWVVLFVGVPALGIYVGFSNGGVLVVVAAAVLGGSGVPLALWWWSQVSPVLLNVAGLLVREAANADPEDRAKPTKMEREAIVKLRDGLVTVRRLARGAEERADPARLQEARERWQRVRQDASGRLSRSNIAKRLQLVEDVLQGGSFVSAEDVPVHAAVAHGIAGETDEALVRVLDGKPVDEGMSLRPENYNPDPEALRRWLEEFGGRWD
jgi:hypothetical protein